MDLIWSQVSRERENETYHDDGVRSEVRVDENGHKSSRDTSVKCKCTYTGLERAGKWMGLHPEDPQGERRE